MANTRNRRERRKTKQSGFSRQPNPGGRVGHHVYISPLDVYQRPRPAAAKLPKAKRLKTSEEVRRHNEESEPLASLGDAWPH
jgi:hypothetical protein